MKANELRKLSTQELVAKEKELKEELFNLRFQLATGQLANPSGSANARRTLPGLRRSCVSANSRQPSNG